MKQLCLIGHFGKGKNLLNGQTIKTKVIFKELKKQLGASNVTAVDTNGGKKEIIKLFFQTGYAMKSCKNVIIMPASNGVRFFVPVLCFWKLFFPHTNIHYIVIGGWLPEFILNKKILKSNLKKFDGIYVETKSLKKRLDSMVFSNIVILPNCKNLKILKEDELIYSFHEPLKLTTFSRILKEKGIEDAIQAVIEVNRKFGREVFSLDLYGQIDESYRDTFCSMKKKFPKFIRYCGMAPFNESTKVLKNYFALLFPTRFYTEGMPGTIIDAFSSGVPVVSARWESFTDFVCDGEVGYGYEFKNYKDLVNTLLFIGNNPDHIINMKKNCLEKAKNFSSDKVMRDFLKRITFQE